MEGNGGKAGGSESRGMGMRWGVRLPGHIRLAVSEPPRDSEGMGCSRREVARLRVYLKMVSKGRGSSGGHWMGVVAAVG